MTSPSIWTVSSSAGQVVLAYCMSRTVLVSKAVKIAIKDKHPLLAYPCRSGLVCSPKNQEVVVCE